MRILLFILFNILLVVFSFSSCDPHAPSDHPCNFPDAETENNLRAALTFKIIDGETGLNLVDTTQDAVIHTDSVVLYDVNFDTIPRSYEYYIDNWIFTNFYAYKDVPFNEPQALLELDERIFYLQTSNRDVDTIKVLFDQCLITEVLFNEKATSLPLNHPYSGGSSFYFKK